MPADTFDNPFSPSKLTIVKELSSEENRLTGTQTVRVSKMEPILEMSFSKEFDFNAGMGDNENYKE